MNHFLGLIRKVLILMFIVCGAATAFVLYYLEFELPDIDALNTVQLQVPLQIFSQDKKLIAAFGEKRRIPLPYNQIPTLLIDAVLATEDQRYFQHAGVDLPGLGRAAVQLALTGRKLQGGSTITMQVARSFYLTRNKTFARKLREILLAIKIEHKLKKEKILELYLNKVFLGNRAYGVEAAAQVYYGKHLNELTVDQFAMLAGLPKAPSTLNPLANAKAAIKRRDHVLARMHDQGYIDTATYNKAINTPLNASYHDIQTEVKAPYVAELTRQQLEQMYGDSIYTDGFKVYTTLDSKLQNTANAAVRTGVLAYDERHGYRGPEGNLGIPSLTTMEAWAEKLKKMPVISNLEPAAVVEMTPKSITVLRANGDMTIIPWSGLSWARKQLNADYLGGFPRNTDQIVKLGDVVRIMEADQGGYQLSQVPKAEGAFVAISPQNGAILAMSGGFDYQTSKFNRVTNANRQPGSSFKPFIYSAALDKGYTLATVINDAPIVIEQNDNSLWRPQNDNHKFYGPTRLRTAIIESRNVVAIRVLDLIGLPYAVGFVQKFGFVPTQLPPGLSLAIGTALVTPLQMAQAYSVFANGGMKVVPFVIDSITNTQNQVVYQAKPLVACDTQCMGNMAPAPRVISAQNAFLITSALHDVTQRGTAKRAKELGRADIAGKTGTTQNQVDAWFAGYNPDIVAVAWVGFNNPQSLHEFGAQAALPIWIQFMQTALKNKPVRPLPQPAGVVSMRINSYDGKPTDADDEDGMLEYFMEPYTPDKQGTIEAKAPMDEGVPPPGANQTSGTPSDDDTNHQDEVPKDALPDQPIENPDKNPLTSDLPTDQNDPENQNDQSDHKVPMNADEQQDDEQLN